ncbi:exported hypothetical protein [Verrucomicrobia bacterium]|nr:exported hypothetical protein [Verrucomicrobiota bacterium]
MTGQPAKRWVRAVVCCLALCLCQLQAAEAAGPGVGAEEQAPAGPDASLVATNRANQDRAVSKLAEQEPASESRVQESANAPQPPSPIMHNGVLLVFSVLILALVAVPIGAALYSRRLEPAPPPPPSRHTLGYLFEKEPPLMAFFTGLWAGMPDPPLHDVGEDYGPLPVQVAKLHTLFSEMSRPTNATALREILLDLSLGLACLKQSCFAPQWRPVWQMASVLERMTKQLARNEVTATPSVLKTLAGGLELLHVLVHAHNLNPRLAMDPPVKLLAVDDNAVCRQALAMALKNAFPELDLAPDGPAGLAKAEAQAYDVIFLDVEMPGIDGFELCAEIHQTALNQTTPVVFVTKHSDFESRYKFLASGGHDLIGKPFLPLEITLKALTLVVGERLQRSGACDDCAEDVGSEDPTAATAVTAEGAPEELGVAAAQSGPAPHDAEAEPVGEMPSQLQSLHTQLEALKNAPDDNTRREVVLSLYVTVRVLTAEAQEAKLDSVFQLGSALEGMLRKIVERAEYSVDPSLETLYTAVESFHYLTKSGPAASAGVPHEPAPMVGS